MRRRFCWNFARTSIYVVAAEDGFRWVAERPLTRWLTGELQRLLVHGTPGEHSDAGRLRDRQVVIGAAGSTVVEARLVPRLLEINYESLSTNGLSRLAICGRFAASFRAALATTSSRRCIRSWTATAASAAYSSCCNSCGIKSSASPSLSSRRGLKPGETHTKTAALTAGQVAQRQGITHQGAMNVLHRLSALGLLEVTQRRRRRLFAAPAVVDIVTRERVRRSRASVGRTSRLVT